MRERGGQFLFNTLLYLLSLKNLMPHKGCWVKRVNIWNKIDKESKSHNSEVKPTNMIFIIYNIYIQIIIKIHIYESIIHPNKSYHK